MLPHITWLYRALQSEMDADLSGNAIARGAVLVHRVAGVHCGDASDDQSRRRAIADNEFACCGHWSNRRRRAFYPCAALSLDHAGTNPRARGFAGAAAVAGGGIVRKSDSLRGDGSLAPAEIRTHRQQFRSRSAVAGNDSLGTADVAAVRLAVHGSVHSNHQFRSRTDGTLSGWLEIRVIYLLQKPP